MFSILFSSALFKFIIFLCTDYGGELLSNYKLNSSFYYFLTDILRRPPGEISDLKKLFSASVAKLLCSLEPPIPPAILIGVFT
jgi:hypothetical protein